ncbi:uncharacterized protein LACBIDRAFT_335334 [Laccaria bicolor S238N-H82]|uniref:Predicted protein n=1 Tax=Laccaria bicolor (strain S238N-H82 / ATCC MYA-4686) TaxID=486041 RepID=B0E210_LACBS|nr:uncharacterized protein LACBIDRAFT_335334 [Laccaria bicolor S238N-H82]EDQ99113.1 predicted protein [Laccaria bicolor S238N-H82]|eukprot:XP_001890246.1 predicted protein [Laccaria bicolor S238N-H82]
MPAYNPYTLYIPSPTMQQSQSTAVEDHKVVCVHAPEPYGSTINMNSIFGGSVGSPTNSHTPLVSPTYIASRPSSLGNPRPLHPHSCIPLPPLSLYGTSINPLLKRGTIPPIKYDIRSPPSFATSRRHLVDDDRWRHERASNPNLGSLTIRTALASKPVVVFPSRIVDGVVTVQDVLLAVHYALRASALDDQHRRRAELWRQGAPRSYHPSEDYEAIDVAFGCYGWAGLTQSPTEGDVWILKTTTENSHELRGLSQISLSFELCETFGIPFLHPFQIETGQNILQKRSTILDVPTRSGKTLAFFYALFYYWWPGNTERDSCQKKIIVIISPLVALMQAQAMKARS